MDDLTEDIVLQAARGDVEAFENIYKHYSAFVYNVALRMLKNIENAQEVTQDVFVTLYRKLETFRFESSLKTWIYRITMNTAINYAKKVSRIQDRTVEFDANRYPAASPSKVISQDQLQKRIDALLSVLNPDQKACVILRSLEGLSYEEIASTLNININTVRSRLKRAREKMLSIKEEVMNL
ncbi:MAG: sigma-70 family RNA polymerase sigma factor [Candidatus Omnitrophica bacterium]|nr:sigma-70 family RNA polymerase sigma factor [Candidatus Omnitrophota bacterium]